MGEYMRNTPINVNGVKNKRKKMDKNSRKVTVEAWLICPNWTEVRRFTKNKNNKDKFFEYIFVDSGIVVGSNGESPPLMKTRKEIKRSNVKDRRRTFWNN